MNGSRTTRAAFVVVASLAAAVAAETPPLAGTAWVLAGLPGRALPAGTAVTLQFERERVTILDGCNRFKAPYKADAGTIAVTFEEPWSRMHCDPERTEIAHVFLTALEGARSYKIEDGRLQLLAMGGDVVALLAPQSAKRSVLAPRASEEKKTP
jgi:heat shock protein HslJ